MPSWTALPRQLLARRDSFDDGNSASAMIQSLKAADPAHDGRRFGGDTQHLVRRIYKQRHVRTRENGRCSAAYRPRRCGWHMSWAPQWRTKTFASRCAPPPREDERQFDILAENCAAGLGGPPKEKQKRLIKNFETAFACASCPVAQARLACARERGIKNPTPGCLPTERATARGPRRGRLNQTGSGFQNGGGDGGMGGGGLSRPSEPRVVVADARACAVVLRAMESTSLTAPWIQWRQVSDIWLVACG